MRCCVVCGWPINAMWTKLNLTAVRLAMRWPLAPDFTGIAYDAVKDTFSATTDRPLTPMFEAIFAAAPATAAGSEAW